MRKAAVLVFYVLLLSAVVLAQGPQSCSTVGQCKSLNNCNAATYTTLPATLQYKICCLPTTVGPSQTYGDGTGCDVDPCAAASSVQVCMNMDNCVPIPYTATTAPSLQCVNREKLCWSLPQAQCTGSKYCAWSSVAGACMWGLSAASTPVPVAAANPCPTINVFVLIMLIFMFVSLVAAIVTVAVVVVINQRKAEREALEEEEAAANGGVQL